MRRCFFGEGPWTKSCLFVGSKLDLSKLKYREWGSLIGVVGPRNSSTLGLVSNKSLKK